MSENVVKPGLGPKEIAILHYQLLMDNNKEEWLKTVKKIKLGISAKNWWSTGRKYIERNEWTYKFRHEDKRFHEDDRRKFFFYKFDKDGNEPGSPVPIIIEKDPDDNNEWRVDVSSW